MRETKEKWGGSSDKYKTKRGNSGDGMEVYIWKWGVG